MHDKVLSAVQDRTRLAALARTRLLDTLPEATFDRLTRLASRLLDTPVALVTLVDRDRQFFKSCVGLREPWASQRETPLSHSFCQHVVASGEPLVLEDAREHPVLCDNLAIPDLGVVAYAGVPLRTSDGQVLGSFCAIDTRPRAWTAEEVELLADLSGSVVSEIEWRRYAAERDEAEAALRRSEAQLRAMFDESAVGIALIDNDGRPVRTNRALREMLGYSDDELRGMVFSQFTHPDDVAADWELFGDLMAGERPHYQLEKRYYHRDGALVWGRLSASLLRDGEGAPRFAIGMVENITEQKEAEEALEQSRSQLLQAQKMEAVGRLAGGIAHDFNNLLTVILGNTQLLMMDLPPGPGDPWARRELEEIQQVGERAAELTRQLLAFSRKQVLHPRVLDLNAVLASTDKLLQRLLGEDVEVRTRLAPDPGHVRADPGQLEQVLVNLAVNARDAMPGGGRITIETSSAHLGGADAARYGAPPGPYVRLSVTDTGTGMDARTQARIFEPFFTTKEPGKGTGLGLSTVYGIVQQSGGFVRVRSEPGRGTTFEVYLPRVDEKAEEQPAGAAPAGRRGTETILLLEDDDAVGEVVRRILVRAGYTVLAARRVEEARRITQDYTGRIHLLVSDIVMPGTAGPDIARELLAVRPEMKVIFMSGYTDDMVAHRGSLDPGAPFLQKPFTPAVLLGQVRQLLDEGGGAGRE